MIPTYLTDWPLWRDIFPLPIFAAIFPLIFVLTFDRSSENRKVGFLVLYALAILGLVTGQLTGQSREPAVGAVVPAALSLLGALSIYLVVAKSTQQQSAAAALVIVFSLNLLVGIFWGTRLRLDEAKFQARFSYMMQEVLARHSVELKKIELEKQIIDLREEHGLPASSSYLDK